METTKKYQLYLLHNTEENVRLAETFRFYRVNKQYILIYTDTFYLHDDFTRYHIIDKKETDKLSDREKVWLLESNMKIIEEETAKKQDQIVQSFSERLSRLEAELEKESERIANGSKDGGE